MHQSIVFVEALLTARYQTWEEWVVRPTGHVIFHFRPKIIVLSHLCVACLMLIPTSRFQILLSRFMGHLVVLAEQFHHFHCIVLVSIASKVWILENIIFQKVSQQLPPSAHQK